MNMTEKKPIKPFDRSEVLREAERLTLYEVLDDSREVLYVGVGPLRLMLKEHLPEGVFPLQEARFYRTFNGDDPDLILSRRKELLEDYMDLRGRPPKYNANV
jgi:hypothetical protein